MNFYAGESSLDLMKAFRSLEATKTNTDFVQRFNHIMSAQGSFENRNLDDFWGATKRSLTPIRAQAEDIIAQGVDLLKAIPPNHTNKTTPVPDPAHQKAKLHFKKEIQFFIGKLRKVSSEVNRDVHHKRSLAVVSRQKFRKAGLSTKDQDKELSLYQMFQKCMDRLAQIPQQLYCEVLGCDSGENSSSPPPTDSTESSESSEETDAPIYNTDSTEVDV